jgi:hypothetical protein
LGFGEFVAIVLREHRHYDLDDVIGRYCGGAVLAVVEAFFKICFLRSAEMRSRRDEALGLEVINRSCQLSQRARLDRVLVCFEMPYAHSASLDPRAKRFVKNSFAFIRT